MNADPTGPPPHDPQPQAPRRRWAACPALPEIGFACLGLGIIALCAVFVLRPASNKPSNVILLIAGLMLLVSGATAVVVWVCCLGWTLWRTHRSKQPRGFEVLLARPTDDPLQSSGRRTD